MAALTEVDAISLSMANLATTDIESLDVAARTIVIAVALEHAGQDRHGSVLGYPALRRTLSLATLPLLIAAGIGAFFIG